MFTSEAPLRLREQIKKMKYARYGYGASYTLQEFFPTLSIQVESKKGRLCWAALLPFCTEGKSMLSAQRSFVLSLVGCLPFLKR